LGFSRIMGQELIIKALRRARQCGEINHAYLFSGPPGSGKKTLALLFAQSLNCSGEEEPPCGKCLSCRKISGGHHPDLYIVKPQGASLKIEQLREIKEQLYYFPREGRKKVCLLQDAELLTLPAANSLLKILEEPPGELVFILLSARPWALPGTVLSRCIHFHLKPLTPEKMALLLQKEHPALLPGEKELIIALARGNPGKGLEMAAQGEWEKKYAQAFALLKDIEGGPAEDVWRKAEEISKREDLPALLEFFALIYRDRLFSQLRVQVEKTLIKERLGFYNKDREGFSASPAFLERICRAILELQGELLQNVNKRLALEVLFLQMRGAV
jgi:DNA polymerase-3 subunit delta'